MRKRFTRGLHRISPLPKHRRERQRRQERQRSLTEQLKQEGHHPECSVWHTRRWCDCKGMPFDVHEKGGLAYICYRQGATGIGGCRH